jgi:hypothetical protein
MDSVHDEGEGSLLYYEQTLRADINESSQIINEIQIQRTNLKLLVDHLLDYQNHLINKLQSCKHKLQIEIEKRLQIEKNLSLLQNRFDKFKTSSIKHTESFRDYHLDVLSKTVSSIQCENYEEIIINTNKLLKKIDNNPQSMSLFSTRIDPKTYKDLIVSKNFEIAILRLTQLICDIIDWKRLG